MYDYLTEQGLTVERASLPAYNTPIGNLIRQWLTGSFQADANVFELLQAADKQQMQTFIHDCEQRGVDVLLMDRYVFSQWAYGSFEHDLAWLQQLTTHMRMPDMVVYLNVAPHVSVVRRGKFEDNDRYEADVTRLEHVNRMYGELLQTHAPVIPFVEVNANLPQLLVRYHVLAIASSICQKIGSDCGCEAPDVPIDVLVSESLSHEQSLHA